MSVSGISSNNLFNYNAQSVQNKSQQFQLEFQQLGQDLKSGNLPAAQADFAALKQSGPQTISTSSEQSNNPIALEFKQLAHDLQTGDLSAAQQDFATIQQSTQKQAAQGHHHHGGHGSGASEITQLGDQLGQALQSGARSTAQQAYSTLQQELQQFTQSNGLPATPVSSPGSSGIAVSA